MYDSNKAKKVAKLEELMDSDPILYSRRSDTKRKIINCVVLTGLAGGAICGGIAYHNHQKELAEQAAEVAREDGRSAGIAKATSEYEVEIARISATYEQKLNVANHTIGQLSSSLDVAREDRLRLKALVDAIEGVLDPGRDGAISGVAAAYNAVVSDENFVASLSPYEKQLLQGSVSDALHLAFEYKLDLLDVSSQDRELVNKIRGDYDSFIRELEGLSFKSCIEGQEVFSESDLLRTKDVFWAARAKSVYPFARKSMAGTRDMNSSYAVLGYLGLIYAAFDDDFKDTVFADLFLDDFIAARKYTLFKVDNAALRGTNEQLLDSNSELAKQNYDYKFIVDSLRIVLGGRNKKEQPSLQILRRIRYDALRRLHSEADPHVKGALRALIDVAGDRYDLKRFHVFEDIISDRAQIVINARNLHEIVSAEQSVDLIPKSIRGNKYVSRAIHHIEDLIDVKKPVIVAEHNSRLLELLSLADARRELNYAISENDEELESWMVKYLWGDARGPQGNIRSAKESIRFINKMIEALRPYFEEQPEFKNSTLFRLFLDDDRSAICDCDSARAFLAYERATTLARAGTVDDLETAVELINFVRGRDDNIFYARKDTELRKSLALLYLRNAGEILVDDDCCDEQSERNNAGKMLCLASAVFEDVVEDETYKRLCRELRSEHIVHGDMVVTEEQSLSAYALHFMRHGEFGESDDDVGEDTAWGKIRQLKDLGFKSAADSLEKELVFYRAFADVNSFYLLFHEIVNRFPAGENPRHTKSYYEAVAENLETAGDLFEMSLRELLWKGNAEWVDTNGDGVLDSVLEDSTDSVPETILEIARNIPLLGSLLDPHRAGERLFMDNYVSKILCGTAQVTKGVTWDAVKYAVGADGQNPLDNITGGAKRILSPVGDVIDVASAFGRAGCAFTRGTLKLAETPLDMLVGWNPSLQKVVSRMGNMGQFLVQSGFSAVPGGDANRRVYSGVPYLSHLFFGRDEVPYLNISEDDIVPLNPNVSARALKRKRTATFVSRMYDCLTVAGIDALTAYLVKREFDDRSKNRHKNNDDIHGEDFDNNGDAFDGSGEGIHGEDGFPGGGSSGNAINPASSTPPVNPAPSGIQGSDGFAGGGSAGDAVGGQ